MVAYWKILAVVRRQATLVARRPINVTTTAAAASDEPAAETNLGAPPPPPPPIQTANVESTKDDEDHRQRNEDTTVTNRDASARSATKDGRDREIGNAAVSRNLSRAQINVVRTLVYIVVCFTLCWMPMYFYYLLSTFEVQYRTRRRVSVRA